MTSVHRQLLVFLLSISDLILLGLTLHISVLGRAAFMPISVLAARTIQVHTIAALVVLFLAWNILFSLIGLYRSKRLQPFLAQITEILWAAGLASLILAVVGVMFRMSTINFIVLLRFLVLTACSMLAWRLAMRQTLTFIRLHGRNLRNVVVIGTNQRAIEFTEILLSSPELGYRVVGFVDDEWVGQHSQRFAPLGLVSSIGGFRSYLRTQIIDEVVIALPVKSFYEQEHDLIHTCREHGVVVRVLTDFFDTSARVTTVHHLGTAPVVTFSSVPLDTLRLALKRAFDVIASSILLVLSSPLLLAVFVIVKLDSRGPVIFTQERIGFNKRRFRIYKFRTMIQDAEARQAEVESLNEAQGPVFKIKRDPRITPTGRFLRKTSIDELPQLFNVLKGEMSLVGPRPLPARDYSGFHQDWHRRRFSVRPGITCLWQISGRSSIGFDEWMCLDMQYIDEWSLWLDLRILARTIPAVMKGSGAA